MKAHSGLGQVLTLLALSACGGDRVSRQEPSPQRIPATSSWDTAWIRGGRADSLLLMPLAVAASRSQVFVLDGAAKRILAFRAADGTLEWTAGGAGGGPGEFAAPTALALTPAGDLLVADPGNARIAVIDAAGSVKGHVPFGGFAYIQGMCVLADGDILVTTLAPERPVLRLSATGEVEQRLDLPWPELAKVPPVGRQAYLASLDDFQGCALTLALGRGFAVYRNGEFGLVAEYVEPVQTPEVEVVERGGGNSSTRSARLRRRHVAATSASVAGGILSVGFEGRTTSAGKIIDRYDVRTGAYRETHEFPEPVTSIAQSGERFVLLHYSAGYPMLILATPSLPPGGGRTRPERAS